MTRTPVGISGHLVTTSKLALGTQDHDLRKVFIGIDPGLSGVLASIWEREGQRSEIVTRDVPTFKIAKRGGKGYRTRYDLQGMLKILDMFDHVRCVAGLEQLTGRPGLSSQSVFGMGRGFGLWEMALAAKHIPVVEVSPQVWKKALDVTRRPGQDDKAAKAESILKAQQLYPWVEFPRVADHNKADAVLLAEHMRRTYTL